MPATPTSLGPYRIERELGRGGMGIVYLAHDTRLNRRVAIKALSDDVAADPDRMARFEREARVLASLNHPNLAAVYDVLEVDGRRYLAMEYVEGESLADRLGRDGALVLAETVEIGHQVAAGMEAAHEQGVVHRDLKPANVMITPEERVKIVDFGLAKGRVSGDEPLRNHAASPVLASSPTLTAPDTMPGVILGTAPYLSPEQARGKAVDRRTDIWSFGCILYECLTGRRLFHGETVSDTLAAILERPFDWSELPKGTPPRLRELLQRCLERDPRRRLRDIGEARIALEQTAPTVEARAERAEAQPARKPPTPLWRRVAPAAGLVGAAVLGWHLFGDAIRDAIRGPAPPVRRLSVVLPPDLLAEQWTLTQDGSTLLLRARRRAAGSQQPGDYRLYQRRLDEDEFRPIEGTERALGFGVSPDGKVVYFLATSPRGPDVQLARVPVDGSSPVTSITPWRDNWQPGTVLNSGKLVFTTDDMTKWATLDAGGASELVPLGISGSKALVVLGDALPQDRGVLLLIGRLGSRPSLGVLDLRSKKIKDLVTDAENPAYDPAGRLLFTRGGTLLAVPFDLQRLEVRGEPVAVVDHLFEGEIGFSAVVAYSRDGTLVYRPGGGTAWNRGIVAVDAVGRVTDWTPVRKPYERWPRLSPDASRITCSISGSQNLSEAWIVDRGRASAERLTTPVDMDINAPIWSPDGSRIAYGVYSPDKRNGIYVQDLARGGPALQLGTVGPDQGVFPTSWSPDGSTILVGVGTILWDVGAVPGTLLAGVRPEEPRLLLTGPANDGPAEFSPDGKWIAYQSNVSGRNEIYVRSFLPGQILGTATLLSPSGGRYPRWTRDGAAICYESPDGQVLKAGVATRPTLRLSTPIPIWDLNRLRIVSEGWDLLPDGRLLGIQKDEAEDEFTRLDVVLHFDRELGRKVRSGQ